MFGKVKGCPQLLDSIGGGKGNQPPVVWCECVVGVQERAEGLQSTGLCGDAEGVAAPYVDPPGHQQFMGSAEICRILRLLRSPSL